MIHFRCFVSRGLGSIIGFATIFAAGSSAVDAAANDAMPPRCDVVPTGIYAMPGDKIYGISLRSRTGDAASVNLTLYSDLKDYRVSLTEVPFERGEPAAEASPTPSSVPPSQLLYGISVFVTLPNPDTLLRVVATNDDKALGSVGSCRPGHADTYYFTKMLYPARPLDETTRRHQDAMVQELSDGVRPVVALLTAARNPGEVVCPVRYRDAVTTNAVSPDYPIVAYYSRLSGKVLVRIDLGSDGSVNEASVYLSSGSDLLDYAALEAARASTYQPAIFRCEPSSGSYIFRADFQPK